MQHVRDEMELANRAAGGGGGAEKEKYVRRIFSEIAPRYDLLNHVLSFNIDRRWRKIAIGLLGWERAPGGTYLDLCAGTLDISRMLAGRRGFAGEIVAADFAEPMLRAGARKVAGRNVRLVVADALRLPLPDGCLDGAIVAFGIRNLASLDAGLCEVSRVLRPGARFAILEFSAPQSSVVRFAYTTYFTRILPMIGRLISGHPTAYRYLPASVASFPSERELAGRMQSAGFRNTAWHSLSFGIAAVHVGEKA